MVVERKDLWFMDDGSLTYTICEDSSPIGAQPLGTRHKPSFDILSKFLKYKLFSSLYTIFRGD
jgi:hypothetical protein